MPKPPPPPVVNRGPVSARNRLAGRLASLVREAHGADAADTLDNSENVGDPAGYVSWGNVALTRAVGCEFPLGRFVEVSGPNDCGKSTMLDQILAACQRDGGLGILADTERTRRRAYMMQLGIDPYTLVWVKSPTIEGMFERAETLVKHACDSRNRAWADALARKGFKLGKLPTELYRVYDPVTAGQKRRKPTAQWQLVQWNNACRAALMQFQRDNGLKPSGVRDAETAAVLKPCTILHPDEAPFDKATIKEIIGNWDAGRQDHRVVTSEVPYIIGWDSVGGTASERELEGSARDVNPAVAAKAIRLNMRRMVHQIDDQAIGWLLVNQEYENLDFGGFGGWQSNIGKVGAERDGKTTYGGGAIKYHSSVRIRLERREFIYDVGKKKVDGHPPIGQVTRLLVFKNKLSSRQAVTETYGLLFGRGACDAWTIYHDLKERGIIKTTGRYTRFTDSSLFPSVGIEDGAWERQWRGFEEYMEQTPGFAEVVRAIYLDSVVAS